MGVIFEEKPVYSLKKEDIPLLRRTGRGKLVRGPILREFLPKGGKVIVVGDYCSALVPKEAPFSIFYDGRTRRRKVSSKRKLRALREFPMRLISVPNRKGEISGALWKATKEALSKRRKVFVLGEEDLASLAVLALAPIGTILVYGVPKKGSCILKIGRKERSLGRMLIGKGADFGER